VAPYLLYDNQQEAKSTPAVGAGLFHYTPRATWHVEAGVEKVCTEDIGDTVSRCLLYCLTDIDIRL